MNRKKNIIIKNTHTRRRFLAGLIGTGIFVNLPAFSSCYHSEKNKILTSRQKEIALFVMNILWPSDGTSPSIRQIKAYEYLLWMLNDKNIDPEENQYTINGLNWVDETAMEDYQLHFEKLNTKQKHKLINKISNTDWGENWLSKMLTIIIEAMFADPIYGSNPEGIAWKWISHNPGQPRPDNSNKYPSILNRKKEKLIITSLEQL